MSKLVKTAVVTFVTLFANTFAIAQDTKPQGSDCPATCKEQTKCCGDFKVNFTEQVSIFNFESGIITKWNSNLNFKVDENIDVDVSLPIFNNNSFDNSTGLGDVNVDFTYKKALDVLGLSVDLVGGVGLPLDGEYSSSDTTFSGGAVFKFDWEAIDFSQSVKYTLVNDYTYMPIFGGFVSDNVFTLETDVKYNVSDKFALVGNFDQYYTDDQSIMTVGPSVTYKFSHDVALNAGVGFAVSEDLDFEDMDTVTSFGVAFKF